VDSVGVDFGALQAGGEGIGGVYKSLLTTLDHLEGQLKPMMSSWTGDAQNAYHVQKKAWDEAAQALGTILAQLGQAVTDAHDNYRGTEKNIGNMWSGA
jgi:ESAT-6 family protein